MHKRFIPVLALSLLLISGCFRYDMNSASFDFQFAGNSAHGNSFIPFLTSIDSSENSCKQPSGFSRNTENEIAPLRQNISEQKNSEMQENLHDDQFYPLISKVLIDTPVIEADSLQTDTTFTKIESDAANQSYNLGIAAIITCIFSFSIIGAILPLTLAIIGLGKYKEAKTEIENAPDKYSNASRAEVGKSLNTLAITLSIIFLILTIVYMIFLLMVLLAVFSW